MTAGKRTRFLDQLDRMVARDRRGAIDDMLQVLRELGAIETAYSEVTENARWNDVHGNPPLDLVRHLMGRAREIVGEHAADRHATCREFIPDRPGLIGYRAELTVVTPDARRRNPAAARPRSG